MSNSLRNLDGKYLAIDIPHKGSMAIVPKEDVEDFADVWYLSEINESLSGLVKELKGGEDGC